MEIEVDPVVAFGQIFPIADAARGRLAGGQLLRTLPHQADLEAHWATHPEGLALVASQDGTLTTFGCTADDGKLFAIRHAELALQWPPTFRATPT